MAKRLLFTEAQLREVAGNSFSWRQLARGLGYKSFSAQISRLLSKEVASLNLDVSHFRGKRRWSDRELRDSVRGAASWQDVLESLGLNFDGETYARIKGHALRLGYDTSHLESRQRNAGILLPEVGNPDVRFLRSAAPSVAAAWFLMRGCSVSLPVEPCAYDFIAESEGKLWKVQVKTTTTGDAKNGNKLVCRITRRPRRNVPQTPYEAEDVDLFFIVAIDGSCYLVPFAEVAGLTVITLAVISHRLVGLAQGLWARAVNAGSSPVASALESWPRRKGAGLLSRDQGDEPCGGSIPSLSARESRIAIHGTFPAVAQMVRARS